MTKRKQIRSFLTIIMTLLLAHSNVFATEPVQQIDERVKFSAAIDTPEAGSIPISGRADLEKIGTDSRYPLSGNYYLTNDIDLGNTEWIPIGNSQQNSFTGTLDGHGHVINNLNITGDYHFAGLFGNAYDATIKNVGLIGANIDIEYGSYSYVGGICGCARNQTIISNCYNTGNISAYSSSASKSYSVAGGICGIGGDVIITNCYNTGNITAYSYSSFSLATSYSGGICGFGSINSSNCYNIGAVSSSANSPNTKLYFSEAGGIFGHIDGAVSTSNCYWNLDSIQEVKENNSVRVDIDKKGIGSGSDTTKPLTSAMMKQQASFEGFDFSGVWGFEEGKNDGYPVLRAFYNSMDEAERGNGYDYNEADICFSLNLPIELLADIIDETTAISAIKAAVSNMSAEQKQSATGIDLVTLYAEEAIARAASTTVYSVDVAVSQANIKELQETVNSVKEAAVQALASSGITVRRELSANITFRTIGGTQVVITIDPSAANTTADNVRIETLGCVLIVTVDFIKENAINSSLVITLAEGNQVLASLTSAKSIALLNKVDTKTYKVSFNKPTTGTVTISLPAAPGDTSYQAVADIEGNVVGGKYNPVNDTLAAKISVGGNFTVKENRKDFSDISLKSKEMQDAISILAAKGIISGTSASTFSPDSPITRAEIAALITRTLSKYDANANGGFNDVKRSDWFFGAVGSAAKNGIMHGMSSTIFAPKVNIPKDQIVVVSARVIRNEMKYKDPANLDNVLCVYADSGLLANWAKADIALATRENLVVRRTDGKFNPGEMMTRGDTAIVLYRMFLKIW